MQKINIKTFDEIDIEKAAELEKECFSSPWSKKGFACAINEGLSYFISARNEAGDFLGYAGMYSAADEGYIYNIAVGKQYRSQGVGTALLQNLLEYSKEHGLSFLSLEVRTSNLNAIKFYKKLGFKELGVRKNFYDFPKEDGIIMSYYFDKKAEN